MIGWFARHPTAANIIMVLLVVIGLMSVSELERETFPEFVSEKIEVSVRYPSATAEDVEESVCARIEDALEGIEFRKITESEAQESFGRVVVEMGSGGDFARFLDDVKAEVDAIDDFPDGAERAIVREVGRTDKVASVAVTADLPPVELLIFCEEICDRLRRVEGVADVALGGFSERRIRVELSPQALESLGITVTDAAAAISDQSLDAPLGSLESDRDEVVVRLTDRRRTARELESIVLKSGSTGAEVRLGDVATIVDAFEQAEDRVLFNGRRAGILEVRKSRSEDALRVLAGVQGFLEDERARQPDGVELAITEDATSVVASRLDMLVVNGIQGIILVFLSMWLFFNWRFSMWVSMGLPVSFFGAFFLMVAFGQSINMITMLGMLLALGLIMDDAIVIAENIAAHRARGKSPIDAAVDGVREVGVGVFSSFVTTICVFGPLTLLEGQIGKVLLVMPIVLIIVLAVSLVEAFLVLPNHLGHALERDHTTRATFRKRIDAGLEFVRERVLGALVDRAVAWRWLTSSVIISLIVLAIALVVTGAVPFKAFPDTEGDTAVGRLLMPQGTPFSRLESSVAVITESARKAGGDEVRNVVVQYGVNADAGESGAHVATIVVDLVEVERRDTTMDDFLDRWRRQVGSLTDVVSLVFSEPAFGPAGRPIELEIIGSDLERAAAASREVRSELARYRGVVDLQDDLRPGKPEIRLSMLPGAAVLGVDARSVADQVRGAVQGAVVDEIQTASGAYEVEAMARPEARDQRGDLERLRVRSRSGTLVPLPSVARMEAARGYSRISRVDGRRVVTLTGDVVSDQNNTSAILSEFRRDVMPEIRGRYEDLEFSWQGESAETAETSASLMRAFFIGVTGIFLILTLQFRSWIEPVVVMIAIPFAFIGVVIGHILMGLPLTLPSMVGFVSLAGIVVNDSIILVEFLKQGLERGGPLDAAATAAARARFRAIFLTSLTTVAGLLPLLFETSTQAQVLIPLTASIVFGLAASTVMVLVGVPVLYTILARDRVAAAGVPARGDRPG